MMQCGDFFRNQELFHSEGCVARSIVMMQDLSFSCPGSSLLLTNFVDKMSQNFLVKMLVNCLHLRNKLMMHHSLMVKEGDQHHFHLWTLHAGFLWSGQEHTFPLTTLLFCFQIILKDPWLVTCDDVFQEFFVCFHLLKDFLACIQSLSFLLFSQEPWHHFGTHLPHAQSVNQNNADRFFVYPNFGNDANC